MKGYELVEYNWHDDIGYLTYEAKDNEADRQEAVKPQPLAKHMPGGYDAALRKYQAELHMWLEYAA